MPPAAVLAVERANERETARLIGEGYPTKEIAAKLGVSVKTTETYRANIFAKLRCAP